MKIAMVLNKADTYGGIIQHAEDLIVGLREIGHHVDFYLISHTKSDVGKKVAELDASGGVRNKEGYDIHYTMGEGTGLWYEPETGWVTEGYYAGTKESKEKFRDMMEDYDAVIWDSVFWFKRYFAKDTDFPILLDAKHPVQIVFIHDANLRDNAAWIHYIEKKFDYAVAVHPAAYNTARNLTIPRVMIFNPQDISGVDTSRSSYHNIKDNPSLFILQNWKSSKRGVDLVAALPYIREDIKVRFGGNGIEWRYLWAKEKTKEKYFCTKEDYPDRPDLWGKPYKYLMENFPGYEYIGWITPEERDHILQTTAFFVDPAWYNINKQIGAHFSRTLVEAFKMGVVPIARGLGLSNSDEGRGDLFNAGINYLNIPSTASPKEFGELVNQFFEITEEEYNRIVQTNYALLSNFDRKHIAKEIEKLINGEPCGWFNRFETGRPSSSFLEKARSQWYGNGENRTFAFTEVKRRSLF